ncbi:WD40/YVTN/BNR-like repeat-containing protein [Gillisia mitskevichiae]|uniref:WD40/YVTN/BNR-like repeat-containing protein n=1 Tax=Gillisia mitskevichiae TaxID=270921 RepID=UPI0015FFAC68|nr:YCF48-related protein [Gillisia mitskevichiae]
MAIILSILTFSCSKDEKAQVHENFELATFEKSLVKDITFNSAIISSKILNNGNTPIIQKGVCWSTNSNPNVTNYKTEEGNGMESFTSNLENLDSNTTYFVRPYAKNNIGISYGTEIVIKTLEETNSSYGIILKTTDGGENWNSIRVNDISNLHSTYFVNESIGYAVGGLGKIIKTIDGGDNWSIQNTGLYILFDVFFADENTGYAVGNHSTILKTDDGGNNWILQESGINEELNSVYFLDKNIGFISGQNGIILKTLNGGEEWELDNDPYRKSSNSIKFTDTNTGFSAGFRGIYNTNDGGSTWNQQLVSAFRLNELCTNSDGSMYAVGYGGFIYKAANAESDWQVNTRNLNYELTTIFFTNETTGFVAGSDGDIFKTTDSGENWTEQESGTNYYIQSIYFTNDTNGIAVGHMK